MAPGGEGPRGVGEAAQGWPGCGSPPPPAKRPAPQVLQRVYGDWALGLRVGLLRLSGRAA